jgi:hypothetical protein
MTSAFHDDLLLDDVRQSLRRAMPPLHVLQHARDAFAWRNVALAVAELAFDSLIDSDDDLARVRGPQSERRLTFQGPDSGIEISVLDGGSRVIGSVHPAHAGRIQLRHPDGVHASEVDAAGTFYFERVPRGSFSVLFEPGDDSRRGFVTEWVTI